MLIQLTAPSKTFLLGEYLALHGGSALLINTNPRFVVKVYNSDKAKITGIHPDSPTNKMLADYHSLLRYYHIDFHDPYTKKGGFGASSSQFLMCYMLIRYLQGENIWDKSFAFMDKLLTDYRQYSLQPNATPPSGADLIAQFHGAMTYYDNNNGVHRSYSWPFPNLGFYLLHTGSKLSTHLHLQTLPPFPYQQLEDCLALLQQNIDNCEEQQFINTVNQYAQILEQLNFVIDHTQQLLTQVRKITGVLAAKGCGAMGADTIVVIVNKKQKANFLRWTRIHKMKIIADERKLSSGLAVKRFSMPKAG